MSAIPYATTTQSSFLSSILATSQLIDNYLGQPDHIIKQVKTLKVPIYFGLGRFPQPAELITAVWHLGRSSLGIDTRLGDSVETDSTEVKYEASGRYIEASVYSVDAVDLDVTATFGWVESEQGVSITKANNVIFVDDTADFGQLYRITRDTEDIIAWATAMSDDGISLNIALEDDDEINKLTIPRNLTIACLYVANKMEKAFDPNMSLVDISASMVDIFDGVDQLIGDYRAKHSK